MSNLGAYQTLTMKAAEIGGVDAMLAAVERSAVVRSAPKLVGTGIVGGAVVGAGVVKFAPRAKSWWEDRHADTISEGERARRELTQLLGAAESDPTNDELAEE